MSVGVQPATPHRRSTSGHREGRVHHRNQKEQVRGRQSHFGSRWRCFRAFTEFGCGIGTWYQLSFGSIRENVFQCLGVDRLCWRCPPVGSKFSVAHVPNPCSGLWRRSATRQTFRSDVSAGGSLTHRRMEWCPADFVHQTQRRL